MKLVRNFSQLRTKLNVFQQRGAFILKLSNVRLYAVKLKQFGLLPNNRLRAIEQPAKPLDDL